MNALVKKAKGHTDHLLGCLIGLRNKYALLRPMIFDPKVIEQWGSREKTYAFELLRHSLYQECVQDIVKLSFDKDCHTPSIIKIVDWLQDIKVLKILREAYKSIHMPIDKQKDESLKNGLRVIQEREMEEHRQEFDSRYEEILKKWEDFQRSSWIRGFRIIRDKITAHLELKLINDKYQFTDISTLGLKWGDVGTAIDCLEQIVLKLNMIIRNASFSMKRAKDSFECDSKAF